MPEAARRKLAASAEPPKPPHLLEHLCDWWRELTLGRESGGMGIASLTWRDLESWSRLTGVHPSPIEQTLILGLDGEFRAELGRIDEQNRKKKPR